MIDILIDALKQLHIRIIYFSNKNTFDFLIYIYNGPYNLQISLFDLKIGNIKIQITLKKQKRHMGL